MNNETANMIYRIAGRSADNLVKAGEIAASDRNATWAKLVADQLSRMNIAVPKAIAAQAGVEAANTSTLSVSQIAGSTVTTTANATVSQAAKGVLRGGLPVALACFAVESAYTAYKYKRGDIDLAEVKCRMTESAAKNSGGLSGAVAGAAIGSAVFPGLGTVVGGIFGGMGGAFASSNLIRRFTRGTDS